MKKPTIYFHIQHLYYLPQFLPVFNTLKQHKINCQLLFSLQYSDEKLIRTIADSDSLDYILCDNDRAALEFYIKQKPDWIIFGNTFEFISELSPPTQTALLYHGIGIKDCYYDDKLADMDIRFVEGEYRYRQIKKRFPKARLLVTGFSKLDPIVTKSLDIEKIQHHVKLDPEKKTLLYAPTFYPSSIENMHPDWPKDFPEFNILIKPHQFSLNKSNYKAQLTLLKHWEQFENVFLASETDYSLIPFMAVADILISEASSAMFEFAALNKPVIWCDFVKLRWNYRGIFKYRYKQRMDADILRYSDIAAHVNNYRDLKDTILNELNNPDNHQGKRRQYTNELLGNIDGAASEKIYQHLISNIHNQ